MNCEAFSVTNFTKSVTTVRALKKSLWVNIFVKGKSVIADFAKGLTTTAIIIVKICMRSTAIWTFSVSGKRGIISAIYRLEFFTKSTLVLLDEFFVIEHFDFSNNRRLIN